MGNDSLEKFMHHIMKMRRLTKIELVNTYWQYAYEIAKTGRLAFIIRGNVSWESEQPDGVTSSNGLWLKSNRYEPVGKHIAEEPVRTYLQWDRNIYEIWGTIAIDIDPNDASASKPLIERAIERATCVNNTMSLLYGASLHWFPAWYTRVRHEPMPPPPGREVTDSWDCLPLSRSQDEQTAIGLRDEHITDSLLPLVDEVETLPPAILTVIKTAIDWHAQANSFASGLNSFVNYWESIELLGNFFYEQLRADTVKRKATKDKKDKIMGILKKGVTPDNCMDLVRRCNEIREPTTRTRILAFLASITDLERMETALFKPDDKTKKSLYKIRNDVAHGKLSEHHFETVESLTRRLIDAQKISREVILLSMKNAAKLRQLLTNHRDRVR